MRVEVANVDKRTMQYLYNDGTSYVFMDIQTYDQVEIPPAIVGDASNFLLENQEAIVASNDGRVLYLELPASVELGGHLHRARPPGRPVNRRHQAGDRRDRRHRRRTVVHHHRREDQGRHPRLVVPGLRLQWRRGSKARKRALDVLYDERGARGVGDRGPRTARLDDPEGPMNDYTSTLVRGVAEHHAPIDELLA